MWFDPSTSGVQWHVLTCCGMWVCHTEFVLSMRQRLNRALSIPVHECEGATSSSSTVQASAGWQQNTRYTAAVREKPAAVPLSLDEEFSGRPNRGGSGSGVGGAGAKGNGGGSSFSGAAPGGGGRLAAPLAPRPRKLSAEGAWLPLGAMLVASLSHLKRTTLATSIPCLALVRFHAWQQCITKTLPAPHACPDLMSLLDCQGSVEI